MNKRFISMMVAVVLLIAPYQFVSGQTTTGKTTGNWSAVQAVAVDDRLIVKQKDGKTIEGKMIEASETNLSLSRAQKVVNISRDNIAQIEHSRSKAAKAKWAAIGAGVGAGAGAAIGQSKVGPDAEIWLPVGVIFGTGIGAGVGALIGASRRQRILIYTAP